MNILITYATYSSGTLSASQALCENLAANHAVSLKKASDIEPDEFNQYELIIMGSPSWLINKKEGQPHQDYFALFERSAGKIFPQKPFAVFGLGDESYAHFCGAVDHLEEYVKKSEAKLMGTSLRIDGYYFNEEKNRERLIEWAKSIISTMD